MKLAMMDFLVMIVQLNVIVKVKFAIKLQESVQTNDVSEDGWEQLAVKNATMVPTALIVKKHAMVAKISLVKDLKEIVPMDALKDLMDISVNLQ